MLDLGYHSVAKGAIATVVTSLAMTARPQMRPEVEAPGWTLERLPAAAPAAYLKIYRAVGEDWLWFSRLAMSDQALAAIIQSPDVEIYHLQDGAGGEALLELDFREAGACELAFFGLSASLIGGPAGRWLINRAIERAWSRPIEKFWVHTCTCDHPKALDFYRRSGFTPFETQVEVFPDPRLNGLLRADAAPHVPKL